MPKETVSWGGVEEARRAKPHQPCAVLLLRAAPGMMTTALAFLSPLPLLRSHGHRHPQLLPGARRSIRRLVPPRAVPETERGRDKASSSAEEITEKYGLEVGLWKIFSSKEEGDGAAAGGGGEGTEKSKADQAKELLAKYGGAYLATSITLSLISFSLCYLLISAGIDVQSLLSKIGIATGETGGKVGTFALAYAAHKAASPIRFPPKVALTPIVASWIGKKTGRTDE